MLSATRTGPVSYSKRAHTFRTAVGNDPAARARLGRPCFVDNYQSRPVPSGFVSELRPQHSPTRIEHGFSHPCLDEFGRADIADDDQGVFADDPRRRLVKLMFARVGDLSVDRADAALEIGHLRPVYLHSTRDNRHPSEGSFRSEAGAKARAFSLGVARRGELAADRSDRIGMNTKKRATARAQIDQIEGAWPADGLASLVATFGFPLRRYAKVPDRIAGASMTRKMLTSRGVLDAKSIGQYLCGSHSEVTSRSLVRACSVLQALARPIHLGFSAIYVKRSAASNQP